MIVRLITQVLRETMLQTNKQTNKQIILTALDNNDSFWFEYFLPFISTLKNTDYKGEIGVIAYNLSEIKKQRLIENNILIFEGKTISGTLVLDRQLQTAEISEAYQYDQIALLDGDIWFPAGKFSLFDKLKESEKLYACYDVLYPYFLKNCVEENSWQEIQQQLDKLLTQQDYVWQVGVLAANKAGWQRYYHYVQQKLTQTNKFKYQYGIDTLLPNLFSVEENGVAYLPQIYNCMPYNGVQTKFSKTNQKSFLLAGEAIEILHITGEYRDWQAYSYDVIYPDKYYALCKAWDIYPQNYTDFDQNNFSNLKATKEFFNNGVEITNITAKSTPNIFFQEAGFFPYKALVCVISGEGRIEITNKTEQHTQLYFSITEIAGKIPTKYHILVQNNQNMLFEKKFKHKVCHISLQPNETIAFLTLECDLNKAIGWVFYTN